MQSSKASETGLIAGLMLDRLQFNGCSSVSLNRTYDVTIAEYLLVILLAGLPFAPESPWYFVRRNQIDKAALVLSKLYPASADTNGKLAMIIRTVDEENEASKSARWIQCFRSTNLIRTCISIGVFACQQLSGIVFVLGKSIGYNTLTV